MKKSKTFFLLVFAAAVVLGCMYIAKAQTEKPIKVRWLLSHQPTDVFKRATVTFADELKKRSGGDLVLAVVTPADIGIASGDVPNAEVFRFLSEGSVEIATAYTVPLGKDTPAFWSVNLPFLFDSYEEAARVLDGDAGRQILDSLIPTNSVRGLAFTMSGGFRIIASKNAKIVSADDLTGKRIATSGGPVAEATLRALGAIPVPLDLESDVPRNFSAIDGVETTYSRLASVIGANSAYTRYINETNHSMFLTTILVGDRFFNSLSLKDQRALREAAQVAAKVEREDSIALGEQTKSALEAGGSIISQLSPTVRASLRAKTQSIYEMFMTQFSVDLIKEAGTNGE